MTKNVLVGVQLTLFLAKSQYRVNLSVKAYNREYIFPSNGKH